MTTQNLTEFRTSHPLELAELELALRAHFENNKNHDNLGICKSLYNRAMTAKVNADAADRKNQLAGGRAAND